MIQEIKNFIDNLNEETFSLNLKLNEGIYIFLDIEKIGEDYILRNEDDIFLTKEDIAVYDGKNEIVNESLFLNLIVNIKPVSPAKIFNPNKKIFNASCSPFALAFNKKNYEGKSQDLLLQELSQYFQGAEKYVSDPQHQIWFYDFKGYCLKYLNAFLEGLLEYQKAKTNTVVYIFLKKPGLEDFIQTHQAYLSEKVFNKDKFNVETSNAIYGISDSLSGFNDKKMFLKHHTAPLEYNYRVSGQVAMQLWRFFQLQKNKQIPNPVPIFVDKQELNEKMISIFNTEEKRIGYAEMVKRILKHSGQKDLQKYYLIYFLGTKGSRVADIDFIPVFKYVEKEAKIEEVFALGGKLSAQKIENVFDLENHIFNRIFNGQLKTDTWLKYFGEIKYDPKYITDTCYNQLLKYRQSIYDFIYKSERQAITTIMFDDMMVQGILDDIRHDEVRDGTHEKEYAIKEKLNIWFSLYSFFTNPTQIIRNNMANRTQEIFNQLQELSDPESDIHLQENDDEAFAFASGQVIWKLLIQSKSSNRTHALLEPFLQKVDVGQFKLAIARTFEVYKHEFTLYSKKYGFDKIMSEVMGFEPKENNMKKLLPFILAGYFSKSIFSRNHEDN